MLGKIERVSEPFPLRRGGAGRRAGRNRQASWYYFCLCGAKGREITITLTDLRGEYNFKRAGLRPRGHSNPSSAQTGRVGDIIDQITLEKDEATFV